MKDVKRVTNRISGEFLWIDLVRLHPQICQLRHVMSKLFIHVSSERKHVKYWHRYKEWEQRQTYTRYMVRSVNVLPLFYGRVNLGEIFKIFFNLWDQNSVYIIHICRCNHASTPRTCPCCTCFLSQLWLFHTDDTYGLLCQHSKYFSILFFIMVHVLI